MNISTSLSTLAGRVRALPLYYRIGGVVLIVAAVAAGAYFFLTSGGSVDAAIESNTPHVRVATVAGLSSEDAPLPVTGKVTSLSRATILAQTSGEIVLLARSNGDYVQAGGVIASFENSSQRAAVLQAQGVYDAAEAGLARARGSTADNTTTSSLAALQSAYSALDDAVHVRADALFINARTDSPELLITVPDSTLVATLKNERAALTAVLANAQAIANTGTPEKVEENSAAMVAAAQQVRTFLGNLSAAVNKTPPSQTASAATLSGYQASLTVARTEVVGAISSITNAKSAYDGNDISVATAAVTQAQGALNAAKANLEKTIIRSPISGTIVSLSITRGDFVSAFSQIAVVSNPGALYIDAQVTPEDARSLSLGNTATIDGGISGVITFIAQALDPLSNKIEVKVGVTSGMAKLTDGEVVTLNLARTTHGATTSGAIVIPVVAAKITPAGPVVFSVDEKGALVAHAIELGSILGDRVTVTKGLARTDIIVVDARGLAEGQIVTIDEN